MGGLSTITYVKTVKRSMSLDVIQTFKPGTRVRVPHRDYGDISFTVFYTDRFKVRMLCDNVLNHWGFARAYNYIYGGKFTEGFGNDLQVNLIRCDIPVAEMHPDMGEMRNVEALTSLEDFLDDALRSLAVDSSFPREDVNLACRDLDGAPSPWWLLNSSTRYDGVRYCVTDNGALSPRNPKVKGGLRPVVTLQASLQPKSCAHVKDCEDLFEMNVKLAARVAEYEKLVAEMRRKADE